MICKNCNSQIPDNSKFCPNCGAEVSFEEPQQFTAPAVIPENLKPLSPWAYFGLQILFNVPIVGFIFLIIFSCKKDNINRRNFARSYWCSLILVAIVILVVFVLAILGVLNQRVLMY